MRGAAPIPADPPRRRPLTRLLVTVLPALLVALAATTGTAPETALPVEAEVAIEAPESGTVGAGLAGEGTPTASAAWLVRLNHLREAAKLPPVAESTVWSEGCGQHAEYLVRNRTYGHHQSPDNPWFTPAGAECGRAGNVISGRMSAGMSPYAQEAMVDAWMTAPFHALGFVNPGLTTVAFGEYAELADGLRHWAATLDIMRGLAPAPQTMYPVMWPSEGATVGLTRYAGNEYPDPLTSCHGYGPAAGLPMLLLMGNGAQRPEVLSSQVVHNGQAVEHCVLTEATYTNPDAGSQQLARAVMAFQNAVIIIPKAPLAPGSSVGVTVHLTTGGHTWGFSVQP